MQLLLSKIVLQQQLLLKVSNSAFLIEYFVQFLESDEEF
jgi:hypothetical protein